MKRKIFLICLIIVGIVTAMVGFAACKNENGKSAYELYVDYYIKVNGSSEGALSEEEWLLSLKGEQGEKGQQGEQGLKGDKGLSAYEIYKKYTHDDPILSEEEWHESLKGLDGKTAYEMYRDAYLEANGSLDGVMTESEWLEALKGKSAYELYRDAYLEANGSLDGAMTESEWRSSLKGDEGVGISSVEIICGDIIITFTDTSVSTIENAYPGAGHSWDDGEITTNPTCLTSGVKTYTCGKCNGTKKEIIDSVAENHIYSDYERNETHHWRTCRLCGNVLKEEHNFNGASKDSDVNDILECECGINKTVGEFYAFKTIFECSHGVSVIVYDSQDYSNEGTISNIAYSRSKTGELLKDGEGQVNFEVVVSLGYKLKGIEVLPASGYKNFKGKEDTGVDNIYRITKVTSDLYVSVEAEIDTLNLPVMVINTENSAPTLDKENYVKCTVSVFNAQEYNFTEVDAGIRLRGNSTMTYPKKSYRVKFKSDKDLFGFGEYKSWVLLALYQDFSGIKDYAAFNFANSISNENSAFVPHSKHVEIYFNGEYIGLYLLTEQVQENHGRVGVEEEFDDSLTEVPFLVEWDENAPNEGEEGVDWFKIVNADSGVTSYYNIKYPEADQRYNQEQFEFIKKYIEAVNTLCHNPAVTIEQFEEYIDLSAFIDYYLAQEFMGQAEINWKSIYMSRAIEGKLIMGPIWDFDWAATGPIFLGGIWGHEGWFSTTNWFAYMLKKDWFFDKVCERWTEIEDTLSTEIEKLKGYKSTIANAAARNAILWDFINDGNPENDFDGYYDKIITFFENRLIWISSQLEVG